MTVYKVCRKYPKEAQQLRAIKCNLLLESRGYKAMEVHPQCGDRVTLHGHDNSMRAASSDSGEL